MIGVAGAGSNWVDGKIIVTGSEGGVEVFVEYRYSFVWVMYCHIVVIDEVWFELRF